jgi:hypothetical protein
MVDTTTLAELAASWILAMAALLGVLWERAKRKDDEETIKKIGQAVAQLEGVVNSINAAVVELQTMRGAITRGVDLAAQAAKLQTVNAILRGIDLLRDLFS